MLLDKEPFTKQILITFLKRPLLSHAFSIIYSVRIKIHKKGKLSNIRDL